LKTIATLAFAALAATALALPAAAEWKPDKPITVIVPYPAGGVTDLVVRVAATDLEAAIGQKIVVVNQPGANGSIGTRAVMDAAKDGYTWSSGGVRDLGTYGVMGMLDTRLGDWHPFIIASIASVLSVNPDTGVDSVPAFVEKVKADPEGFLVATVGPNSSGGVALNAIATAAGITPKQIVYDGGNPAVLATVTGEAQATTQLALEQAEMIRAGKLKPLAVVGRNPLKIGTVEIPAITDDLPKLPPSENFVGIYLPAGTPPEVIETLSKVWVETLSKSEALASLCETRGCGVHPVAGATAVEEVTPLVAAAAWGLFDRNQAKVSPDTLGIARPKAE
jgi:tripartite-type tricarboxylate transporter receptor subunit TctC